MSLKRKSGKLGIEIISVQSKKALSQEQMLEFLQASDELQFEGRNREEVRVGGQTLREQGYRQLERADRGMVHRFMEKMTGLSRAQITRLVSQYLLDGEVKAQRYRRRRFPTA